MVSGGGFSEAHLSDVTMECRCVAQEDGRYLWRQGATRVPAFCATQIPLERAVFRKTRNRVRRAAISSRAFYPRKQSECGQATDVVCVVHDGGPFVTGLGVCPSVFASRQTMRWQRPAGIQTGMIATEARTITIRREGGVVSLPEGCPAVASAHCREHGVRNIVDEIQTGIGQLEHSSCPAYSGSKTKRATRPLPIAHCAWRGTAGPDRSPVSVAWRFCSCVSIQ